MDKLIQGMRTSALRTNKRLESAHKVQFYGVYDVKNNYVFKKKMSKIDVNFSRNVLGARDVIDHVVPYPINSLSV